MSADMEALQPAAPLYARFSRRFRGIFIDWALSLAVIFGAVALATAVRDDNFSRALGVVVIIALLLYEPMTVSLAGGTLGHYLTNLRVVDDAHHGNVSFIKACVRFIIKSILGLYSFIVITATRRSQALHDLLTHSTVQIRDPAKASYSHYIEERTEAINPGMPPAWRRLAIIFIYLILVTVPYIATLGVVGGFGIVSKLLGGIWIAGSAACIGFGWRGYLPGARRSASV